MKKRLLSAGLSLCMMLSCIPVAAFAAEDTNTVYITTAEQLKQLADEVNAGDSKSGKTYILQNDLDLSVYAKGKGWTPIGTNKNYFEGVFDGEGHTISNLTIKRPDEDYQGLFGCIHGESDAKAKVTDVIVSNADIQGGDYVGSITGLNLWNTELDGCAMVGGTVVTCGSVTGGITGRNYSVVKNCYAAGGSIEGSKAAATARGDYIGGIVGMNGSTIESCYVSGNVIGDRNVGGIAGCNSTAQNTSGTIRNCYVTGNVTGYSYSVGGIVGDNNNQLVQNCYVTGNVHGGTAYSVGGIAGYVAYGTVENCAALNSSVQGDRISGNIRVFRVTDNGGNGTNTNNYAWSGMTVNGAPVTDGAADNRNGADLTATVGVLSKQLADIFSDKDAWDFTDNKLPTLKGINAKQNNAMPEHIVPKHDITVTVDGGGTASASDTAVQEGETVTLTAAPNEGYHFKEWAGNVEITDNAFTMGAENVNIKAIFEKDAVKNPFEDVHESDWFYEDVMYVKDKNIMNGMSETKFEPQVVKTRAMMATILWRMDGEPAPSKAASFTDVQAGQWYTDAVAWAQENSIVNGYGDGTFGINDSITREQMVTMFHRYAQYKGYDTSKSTDLSAYSDAGSVSGYAQPSMQWAVGVGLIKGRTDTTIEPQGTATRAESAAIIHRFDTIVKK